jgi:hypothetical protein
MKKVTNKIVLPSQLIAKIISNSSSLPSKQTTFGNQVTAAKKSIESVIHQSSFTSAPENFTIPSTQVTQWVQQQDTQTLKDILEGIALRPLALIWKQGEHPINRVTREKIQPQFKIPFLFILPLNTLRLNGKTVEGIDYFSSHSPEEDLRGISIVFAQAAFKELKSRNVETHFVNIDPIRDENIPFQYGQLASRWEGIKKLPIQSERNRELLLNQITELHTIFSLINERFGLTDADFSRMQDTIIQAIKIRKYKHYEEAVTFQDFIFDHKTRDYLSAVCQLQLYKFPAAARLFTNTALENRGIVNDLIDINAAQVKALAHALKGFIRDNPGRFPYSE